MNKEMAKMEVDQFKREMSSCRYYCRKLIDVNFELETLAVSLYEVAATDYSQDTGTTYNYQTPKLGLMMREEELTKEASRWKSKINYCRNVLSLCDPKIKGALVRLFIYNENQDDVAHSLSYSRKGAMYTIDTEIKSIIVSPLAND